MYDARTLHVWLGSGEQFTKWIKLRIRRYGFEKDVDFFRAVTRKVGRGRPRSEILVTRDMAKELAMVENTEIGRKTRRYFIQMEAAAVAMAETAEIRRFPELARTLYQLARILGARKHSALPERTRRLGRTFGARKPSDALPAHDQRAN